MSHRRLHHVPFRRRSPHAGFTIVELAVVLFIVTLVLGSILVPLGTQVEQRQISDTQKTLEEIREALIGFAAANGYLPCPDRQTGGSANDGVEDVLSSGQCAVITGTAPNALAAGNLPWVTLGLGQQDIWGNRIRYTVLEAYARRPPATVFGLGSVGGLRVCAATTCPGATALTTSAVAVIISHGKNGASAINAATNLPNAAATSPDEVDNANNDRDAVSRTHSNVSGAVFDDIVVWLPQYILNSRMLAAGKLP